jgi:4-amino-4-deoxy-L-arabinose transferase-like glycosyltransferase
VVLLLWTLLLLLNPVGYIGGGSDDGRYLEAAQCVVARGTWCTPTAHWGGRWPTVAPLAAAIALLGESRLAVGLASAPWAAASLLLLMALVKRWVGAAAAVLAGCVLALTPVFTLRSLTPNADVPELTLLMAAWLAADRRRPLLAGLMLGLAICTRETAAVALVIMPILWALQRPSPGSVCLGAFGLVLPLAAEGMFYGVTAGDPLLRLHLALAHTRIPSSELMTQVDPHLPFLNMDLVRNWRPATGIHVHWLLDPLLNLLASPLCGIVLLSALGLVILRRDRMHPMLRIAAAGSAAVTLMLIFVFAIDPKPRMFLAAIAAAAAVVGADAAERLALREYLLPLVLLGLIGVKGIATLADQPNLLRAERTAAAWLATAPPELVLDPTTKSRLALVREASAFGIGDKPPRLAIEVGACAASAARSRDVRAPDGSIAAAIRRTGLLLAPREPLSLCLYR